MKLLIICLLFCVPCLGLCQASDKGIQYMDQSWMGADWSENDAAYVKAKKEIEGIAGDKERLAKIIADSLKKCESAKATSLDLFRWATAVLTSAVTFDDWRRIDGDFRGKKPYDLFPQLSKAKSYEFTRVRFLYTAKFDFPHHNLVSIGEKLLARNANDAPVVRMVLKLYQPQVFPSERIKGVALVNTLETMAPNTLPTLSVISDFYHKCWMKSKSRSDATEALKRSEQALKLSKSKEQIQIIRRVISELRANI